MTNKYKVVMLCFILLLFSSCSKVPDENDNKNTEKTSKKTESIQKISVKDLILTSSDIGDKYTVATTSFYNDRASLKFLKRPVNGVEVIHQDFHLIDDHSEDYKITLLILNYDDIIQAKKEIELNFNILENLANKDNVESFQINVFGDQSMCIKFQSRPNPLYLYSRYGNIVVKINGGKNSHMDILTDILKKIEGKLTLKRDN